MKNIQPRLKSVIGKTAWMAGRRKRRIKDRPCEVTQEQGGLTIQELERPRRKNKCCRQGGKTAAPTVLGTEKEGCHRGVPIFSQKGNKTRSRIEVVGILISGNWTPRRGEEK